MIFSVLKGRSVVCDFLCRINTINATAYFLRFGFFYFKTVPTQKLHFVFIHFIINFRYNKKIMLFSQISHNDDDPKDVPTAMTTL